MINTPSAMPVKAFTSAMSPKTNAPILPRLEKGIQEVSEHLSAGLRTMDLDELGLQRLSAAYKGLSMVEAIDPLERVMIDTLGKLIGGTPETSEQRELRSVLHRGVDNPKARDEILAAHLHTRGLNAQQTDIAIKALTPVRNLIANHASLASLETARKQTRLIFTP